MALGVQRTVVNNYLVHIMKSFYLKYLIAIFFALSSSGVYAATDSYRWLHVTIDTPWAIFIFLLPMVLLPAILMAILYWKFSGKKTETAESNPEKKN